MDNTRPIKAYRITSKWASDDSAIVGAATRGKAIHSNLLSARDAGIDRAKFTDFSAKRAPEYDGWVATQSKPSTPFSEDYVKEMSKQALKK